MAKPYKQFPQKPQQRQQQAQEELPQDQQVGQQDASELPPEGDAPEAPIEGFTDEPLNQTGVSSVSQPADLGTQDASTQASADNQAGASVEVTQVAEAPAVPAIEDIVQPLAAPMPAEVAQSLGLQEPVVEEKSLSEEEAYLEKIRESGTSEQKRILAAIETFVDRFNPKKPLSAEVAVAAQHELVQHLLWLLKKDYDVFKGGWNVLLVYFAVHHGNPSPSNYSALSEYSASRAGHAWSKSPDLLKAFLDLITILRATRVKATRQHNVKRLAFEKLGSEFITEEGLTNLKKFYGV